MQFHRDPVAFQRDAQLAGAMFMGPQFAVVLRHGATGGQQGVVGIADFQQIVDDRGAVDQHLAIVENHGRHAAKRVNGDQFGVFRGRRQGFDFEIDIQRFQDDRGAPRERR